jgi:hypothetical protein
MTRLSDAGAATGIPTVLLSDIDDPHSFYLEGAIQGWCASCHSTGRFEIHHCLPKQVCRRERAPLHSPDNALRVCAKSLDSCHERHTSGAERLPLACLRDENIAFMVRWLRTGPAYNLLTRDYAGADPRVDAILKAWMNGD